MRKKLSSKNLGLNTDRMQQKQLDVSNLQPVKKTNRRWLILALFASISFLTAFHWMLLAIVPDISMKYFKVQQPTIIWTTTTYMVVYCCTIWVASWATESRGLRTVAILASGVCAMGAGIKVIAIFSRQFWQYEIGQIMCAFAETFIVSLPARVASLWFPSDEISTATSIGVFGNQLGVALSFMIPTYIVTGPVVKSNETYEFYPDGSQDFKDVRNQLIIEHSLLFIAGFVVFVLACCIFKDQPTFPPSVARARVLNVNDTQNIKPQETLKSYFRLFSSKNFVLLSVGYGLLVGVYYALSGNINLIIGPSLPEGLENKEQKIGEMGTIMVIAGSTASIFAGCILDAVKKFKVVSLACYGITLIMYMVWTYVLQQGNLILDFIIAGLLGFFMTGYLPIGFEFASEISWPESEATSSGFLNLAAMLVGAILTPITEKVINSGGVRSANIVLCCTLFLGMIITGFMKEDNRRQAADQERANSIVTSQLLESKNNREDFSEKI